MFQFKELEQDVKLAEGDVMSVADGTKTRLRQYGSDKFLFSSRGFHWMNEVPYKQYGPRTEYPPKIMPPPRRPKDHASAWLRMRASIVNGSAGFWR